MNNHLKSIAWHLCMILVDDNMDKVKRKFEDKQLRDRIDILLIILIEELK